MSPYSDTINGSSPTERHKRLPTLNRSLMSDEVYSILRLRILQRDLLPGERLDLNAMERDLGVSRSPLKAALHRLMLEGLVEIKPQSGTFVTAPTWQDGEELIGVRSALEIYAAGQAAQRMNEITARELQSVMDKMHALGSQVEPDARFDLLLELDCTLHSLIVDAADNSMLKKIWDSVHTRYRTMATRFRRTERDMEVALADHQAIVDALVARNAPEAQRLMALHLERSRALMMRDFGGSG